MKTQLDAARPDALVLSEYLHRQAAYVQQHAPSLTDDIRHLQDAAALLDAYQAGLVPVTPHPITRSELVQWISVEDHLPDSLTAVLIFNAGDPLDKPWPGYRSDSRCQWFAADGTPLWKNVTHWADMPIGPSQVKAPSSTEEAAA